jgi:hypothetical protein
MCFLKNYVIALPLDGSVSRRDLGRGILGLVGLEEKMEMETNEIHLLSSIDGFGDE